VSGHILDNYDNEGSNLPGYNAMQTGTHTPTFQNSLLLLCYQDSPKSTPWTTLESIGPL